MTRDTVYWIWLQLVFGVGTRRAELMMSYFQNPAEIFEGAAAKNRVAGMLTPEELAACGAAMDKAKELLRRTQAKGVLAVTPEDDDYPALLGQIYSKPAVLYVKGDLGCLRDSLAIAMVGSRKFTDYGKQAARRIAGELARGGAVVVSGLAPGIDTESHSAALDAGGKSVGVLGCGIDVNYPKGSSGLKRRICENGAVVTEYPLGTEPLAGHFPVRNRVISGMCHGVAVIEADLKSGSLLTAHHALEQGRDIFAVPGSIFSDRTRGAHKLIQEGARLTAGAQDIFDEYGYLGFRKNIVSAYNPQDDGATIYIPDDASVSLAATQQTNQKEPPRKKDPPEDLSGESLAVFRLMGEDAVTAEQIAEMADMGVAEILSALTELEIYGLIQGYPGRKFALAPS